VAGRAVGSASWAQGRGHCGGDGQADASAGGHGRKVVAVEPVAGMRERLAAALTDVELLDGVAEAIPLDDASVHAATVGQAFHWFDGDRPLIEIIASVVWAAGSAVVYNRRRSSIRFGERSRRSFAHSAVKRPPTAAVAGATRSRARASGQRSRRSSFRMSSCSTARA
jgi:hypothetical protein